MTSSGILQVQSDRDSRSTCLYSCCPLYIVDVTCRSPLRMSDLRSFSMFLYFHVSTFWGRPDHKYVIQGPGGDLVWAVLVAGTSSTASRVLSSGAAEQQVRHVPGKCGHDTRGSAPDARQCDSKVVLLRCGRPECSCASSAASQCLASQGGRRSHHRSADALRKTRETLLFLFPPNIHPSRCRMLLVLLLPSVHLPAAAPTPHGPQLSPSGVRQNSTTDVAAGR